jgi:hypothetical protein
MSDPSPRRSDARPRPHPGRGTCVRDCSRRPRLPARAHDRRDHRGLDRRGRGARVARDHLAAARSRRHHLDRAPAHPARRATRRPRAGGDRDRRRDSHGVHGLGTRRPLHLPTAQRPAVRPTGARAALSHRTGARAFAAVRRAAAPGDRRDARRRRCVGRLGSGLLAALRCVRRDLLRLPRGLPARGARAAGLRRRVPRLQLSRAHGHVGRHLGLGDARPDRPRQHRQPAERHSRRVLLLRCRCPRRGRVAAGHDRFDRRPHAAKGPAPSHRLAPCCSR